MTDRETARKLCSILNAGGPLPAAIDLIASALAKTREDERERFITALSGFLYVEDAISAIRSRAQDASQNA